MGSPSSSPCPPPPPASAIRASLAAPEPRIDAGPRVSQACVTAPRRQGGLSQSEGTVRAALRPAPFRSAEPARPGRREGGTRPQLPQLHALPLPRDLSPRALPRGLSAPRAGAGPGPAARERARREQSRVRGARLRVPSQPQPVPVASRLQLSVGGRGGRAPATRRGLQLLRGRSGAESAQRSTRDR